MDTVRLRQKIITKLVDEGRGMVRVCTALLPKC